MDLERYLKMYNSGREYRFRVLRGQQCKILNRGCRADKLKSSTSRITIGTAAVVYDCPEAERIIDTVAKGNERRRIELLSVENYRSTDAFALIVVC